MAKNNKVTISVNIDSVLVKLIKEQAEKENRAVSNLLECILRKYFSKRGEIKDGKFIEVIE